MSQNNLKYIYSIVNYQLSMFENKSIPLAVIVLSPSNRKLMLIGQETSTLGFNGISKYILENIKTILHDEITNALKQAVEKGDVENSFFEIFSENNKWNLFASPTRIEETEKQFEIVALSLFHTHIGSQTKAKAFTAMTRPKILGDQPVDVMVRERKLIEFEAVFPQATSRQMQFAMAK